MRRSLRNSGIDIIGDVPWGTHFCQFYHTKEDLLDILVPYFKAGLENNEFCIWVTSEFPEVEDIKEALRKAVSNFDTCLEKGQIEIIPYTDWYLKEGSFHSEYLLSGWVEKFNQAQDNSYDGVRISGDISWIEREGWDNFLEYKKQIDYAVDNYRTIALCTCFLDRCSTTDIIELAVNHQFALIKREGEWEQIESFRRKKAEETAFQTVNDWEQTFNTVPDLIAIIDNEYRILRVNRAMAAKLGLKPEVCIGLTCYNVVHGMNEPPSFCPHKQMLKDGLEHTIEIQENILGDTFSVTALPFYDVAGELTRCIHIARDITEHKQIEKSLQESEERFRSVLENSLDSAYRLDLQNNHFDYMSPVIKQITGFTPEEINSMGNEGLFNRIHPEDQPRTDRAIKQSLFEGVGTHEYRFKCKDRKYRWLADHFSLIRDKRGLIRFRAGIVRDITNQKQIEKSLQESEVKYRNMIETANEGILTSDSEFRVTYVNKKMEEMFGYSQEEMIGKSELDFIDEESKAISSLIRENIRQGINEPIEIKLKCKNGSFFWALANYKPNFDKDGKFIGSLVMLTDITKHKQEESRISRYNRVLEGINWIFSNVVQAKTEEELGNTCLSVALEVTGSEFGFINEIGEDGLLHDVAKSKLGWEQCLMYDKTGHPSSQSSFVVHGLYGSVIKNEKSFYTNNPPAHPDSIGLPNGHPPLRSFLGVPLVQNGKTLGLVAVANRKGGYSCEQQEDLEAIVPTVVQALQRKRSEEALRLSNIYNRSLIEVNLDPLVTIGLNGKITDVNYATEQVTGYPRNELIGTDFSDYFTEPEKARTGYQQVFMQGEVRDYPLEIQHKDGHITPVLYNASVYRDENNEVIGVFAAARDITELKKAEEKIRILANAVESSEDAIITKSLEGIISSWNRGAEKIYGYLAEEVLGKNISILEPADLKGEIKRFSEMIEQGEKLKHYETLREKKDGTKINVSVTISPVFNASGELIAVSTIARDITERKKAEEAIRLSNLYNRSLIEASLDPLVTIGLNGKITDVNYATEQVTGYPRNELIGTDFSDYFTEPEKARTGYQQVFMQGEVRDYLLEIQHKDGHITPVLYNASVYRDENNEVIGVFAAARDITERKRAEDALLESESRLRLAQASAGAGIWDWNISTDKLEWSEELFCLFGLDSRKSNANFDVWRSILHPDDRLIAEKRIETAVNTHIPLASEYRIVLPSGEVRWINALGNTTYDSNWKPQRMSGICIDITERKKAEEAVKKAYDNLEILVKERTAELEIAYKSLKESETGLAEAQRLAHVGNWDWNVETGEGYWSDELYRIFGRSLQKASPSYDELLNYIHPDDRDYVGKSIKKGLDEGPKDGIDYRIILDNGEERVVHSRAEVTFNEKNIPIRVKGIVQDITKQRKTEEKTKILADAVECSNDAIVTLSLEGTVKSWNKGAEQIYGYSAQEILGKNVSIIEPNNLKGEIKSFCGKIRHGEQIQYYESIRLKKDGTLVNISAALSPVFNASGELVSVLAISRDITERIETEKTLAKIDKLRIKEIHHRIKNNLQVITSLLDLQAEKFQDQEVLEAFKESQNRVISMALIHEELYKGEGTDTLNFSTYLQKLAETLFHTYSLRSKNVGLVMDLEKSACFNMDIAVPLGIIVNELVSNSLKHGFNENEKGEIRIKLWKEIRDNQTQASTFNLVISDNGRGIPESVRLETFESLGLKLVNILIEQLDGKIELNRAKGTEFRLIFKIAGTK